MLPDRVMRGKKGSELQARHGVLSGFDFLFVEVMRLRGGASERNRVMSRAAECRHALGRCCDLLGLHGSRRPLCGLLTMRV
jgi:hypothetical protein